MLLASDKENSHGCQQKKAKKNFAPDHNLETNFKDDRTIEETDSLHKTALAWLWFVKCFIIVNSY